jgi:hypothetical protein
VFYGGIEARPVGERAEEERGVLEEALLQIVGLWRNSLEVWRIEVDVGEHRIGLGVAVWMVCTLACARALLYNYMVHAAVCVIYVLMAEMSLWS